MSQTEIFPRSTEQERQQAKWDGIRNAWRGIPDPDRRAALAFYINYAKVHETFTGGDVLAAWRRTDDPIAQQDWRNRWGALSNTMKKWGIIAYHSKVKPRNKQSHGDSENLWQSLVYEYGLEWPQHA